MTLMLCSRPFNPNGSCHLLLEAFSLSTSEPFSRSKPRRRRLLPNLVSLSHDGKPSNTCSRFVRLEMVVFLFIGFLLISCALRNIITTDCYHKTAIT